jgi:hypothetical protein
VCEGGGGREADRQAFLAGCKTEPQTDVSLPRAARSSDTLPGITASVSGFIIRFTRAAGTLWLLFGVSVSKAEMCSSSINSMERWRIFPAG